MTRTVAWDWTKAADRRPSAGSLPLFVTRFEVLRLQNRNDHDQTPQAAGLGLTGQKCIPGKAAAFASVIFSNVSPFSRKLELHRGERVAYLNCSRPNDNARRSPRARSVAKMLMIGSASESCVIRCATSSTGGKRNRLCAKNPPPCISSTEQNSNELLESP